MVRNLRFSLVLLLLMSFVDQPRLAQAGPRKGPGVPVDGVRFVNSRYVKINYQTAKNSPQCIKASLYVTRDKGATWELWNGPTPLTPPIAYEAPDDGLFGFFIVLENEAGASSHPPLNGTSPQQWVRIDTKPPFVQLLALKADQAFETNREIRMRWRTEDENLMDRPITLHYRTEESRVFVMIADSLAGQSEFRWNVPVDVRGRVEIKITARDLAGKTAEYKTDRLHVDGKAAEVRTLTAGKADEERSPKSMLPAGHDEPDAAGIPVSPQAIADARKRFEQGTYHRMRGEHDLAAARLEAAVKSDPNYLEAWHDLAGIHLIRRKYVEAERIFTLILSKDSQYLPAMKGLALVQASQKNYKSARKTLERLLLLAPDDAEIWLYYGDVVMFSGDRGEARDSWSEAARMVSAKPEIRNKAEKRLAMYPGDDLASAEFDSE